VCVVSVTLLRRRLYSQCNEFLYGVHLTSVAGSSNCIAIGSVREVNGDTDGQLITLPLGVGVTVHGVKTAFI
jgi:hypothetical protein